MEWYGQSDEEKQYKNTGGKDGEINKKILEGCKLLKGY